MEEADDSLEEVSGMILTAILAKIVADCGRGIGRIVFCGRKLRDADRLAAEFLFAVCAVNDKTQAAFFFRGGFHIVFNDGFAGRMVELIERFRLTPELLAAGLAVYDFVIAADRGAGRAHSVFGNGRALGVTERGNLNAVLGGMVIAVSALVFNVGGAGLRTGGGHVRAIDFIKVMLVVSVYDYITMITGRNKGIQTVSEICYVAILRGGGLASVRTSEFNVQALNDGATVFLLNPAPVPLSQ